MQVCTCVIHARMHACMYTHMEMECHSRTHGGSSDAPGRIALMFVYVACETCKPEGCVFLITPQRKLLALLTASRKLSRLKTCRGSPARSPTRATGSTTRHWRSRDIDARPASDWMMIMTMIMTMIMMMIMMMLMLLLLLLIVVVVVVVVAVAVAVAVVVVVVVVVFVFCCYRVYLLTQYYDFCCGCCCHCYCWN